MGEQSGKRDSSSTAQPAVLGVVFDHLPALIGFWDRDLHNVSANAAYLEWFGRRAEDVVGRHIREIIGEDVYALNLPYILGALNGRTQEFERTLVDAGGRARHTQTMYIPVLEGPILGFIVQATDVSARVEAQRAMNEAQRLAEVGSWTWKPDVDSVVWSDQLYRIFAQDPQSFTPSMESVLTLIDPADREGALARAGTARAQGRGYEATYRIVRPDGERRHVLSRTHTEQGPDGTVITLSGTIQDVTEQVRAAREVAELNERLDSANRVQADMLAMLGHDARDHIATVRGSLDLLGSQWQALTDDIKIDFVHRAGRGVRRLQELLDEVLTMMSAESGTIAARAQQVRVLDIVRTALAGSSHADLVEIEGDPRAVATVDPFHLRQIVLNLAGNAVKYGRPPVSVTVRTGATSVMLSVCDSGEGVPPDFAPRLFERFARATTGVATTKQGTGFGLYIVRELARANGGEITYRPNLPGGSIFELTLPIIPGGDP